MFLRTFGSRQTFHEKILSRFVYIPNLYSGGRNKSPSTQLKLGYKFNKYNSDFYGQFWKKLFLSSFS